MNGCHIKPEQFFNLIFGYYDTVLEMASVAGTAGNVVAYGTAVPVGEVWVITSVEAHHSDATARKMMLLIDRGGVLYTIDWPAALATWVGVSKQGHWVLKAADKVGCRFDSLAVGATGYLYVNGYKMKVA